MSTADIGTILNDVQARLKSLPEHVTNDAAFEARAGAIAKQIIEAELANPNSEFVRKIRDERAFPSKEALLDQIRADVASLGLS